jgi:hypothetical protein
MINARQIGAILVTISIRLYLFLTLY